MYFFGSGLGIPTLRGFLDDWSELRGHGSASLSGDVHRGKVQHSVTTSGVLIAGAALFTRLVDKPKTAYQHILETAVLALAMATGLLLVLAIDVLDTSSNPFSGSKTTASRRRTYFYRGISPLGSAGGVTYAYLGHAMLTILIAASIGFSRPWLTPLGVAFYMFLSFPFRFSYIRLGRIVEIDGRQRSHALAFIFPIYVVLAGLVLRLPYWHWA